MTASCPACDQPLTGVTQIDMHGRGLTLCLDCAIQAAIT